MVLHLCWSLVLGGEASARAVGERGHFMGTSTALDAAVTGCEDTSHGCFCGMTGQRLAWVLGLLARRESSELGLSCAVSASLLCPFWTLACNQSSVCSLPSWLELSVWKSRLETLHPKESPETWAAGAAPRSCSYSSWALSWARAGCQCCCPRQAWKEDLRHMAAFSY